MPRKRKTVQRRKRCNLLRTRSLRRKTRRIRGGTKKIEKIQADAFEPQFLKLEEPYRLIRHYYSYPDNIIYGRKSYSKVVDKPDDFDEEKHMTVKEDNELRYGEGQTYTRVKFNESEQSYEPFDETYEQFATTKL